MEKIKFSRDKCLKRDSEFKIRLANISVCITFRLTDVLREQQQMYQQQQTQVQPQVIQQPAAPVVVQAAPQHDNTLMNMAMGAMIGHALTGGGSSGNNDTHVIERKTVIINNHPEVPATSAPVQTASAPVAPVQSTHKPSAMDMNKLSGASSFSTRPVPVRQSMNMSKLSSKR